MIFGIPNNGGVTVGIDVDASNVGVYNNTVTDVAGLGIRIVSGSGNSVRNNIAFDNSADFAANTAVTTADNLFGTDPLFVSAASGDFQLQAGSPAIDRGATISVVTMDRVGVSRPQGAAPDIGAYEWKPASLAPATPTGLRVIP